MCFCLRGESMKSRGKLFEHNVDFDSTRKRRKLRKHHRRLSNFISKVFGARRDFSSRWKTYANTHTYVKRAEKKEGRSGKEKATGRNKKPVRK